MNTVQQKGYVKKLVSLANLPSWIKPGEACRWWSDRDDSWLNAVIHGLDEVQCIVKLGCSGSDEVIHVHFGHFARPPKKWFLQRLDSGPRTSQVRRQNLAHCQAKVGKDRQW